MPILPLSMTSMSTSAHGVMAKWFVRVAVVIILLITLEPPIVNGGQGSSLHAEQLHSSAADTSALIVPDWYRARYVEINGEKRNQLLASALLNNGILLV